MHVKLCCKKFKCEKCAICDGFSVPTALIFFTVCIYNLYNPFSRVMSGRSEVVSVKTVWECVPMHWEFKITGCSPLTSNTPREVLPLVGVYQQRSTSKFPSDSLSVVVPVWINLLIYTDMTQTALPQRVSEQIQTITSPLRCLDQEQKWQHLDWIRQVTGLLFQILELLPLILPPPREPMDSILASKTLEIVAQLTECTSITHLVRNNKMDWSTILSLFVPLTALHQTRARLAVLPTLTPPPLSPLELTVPVMEHVNTM